MPLPSRALALVACLALTGPAAAPALADASNRVTTLGNFQFRVGQARVIFGLRGECGKLPDAAALAEFQRKAISVGTITTGRPGVRQSRACNGDTPVMELILIAERPGRETLRLEGNRIDVVVRP